MKRKNVILTGMLCLTMMAGTALAGCSDGDAPAKKDTSLKVTASKVKTVEDISEDAVSKVLSDNKYDLATVDKDYYFRDAIFIGDSRTQGLMMFSTMENARFYADKGMSTVGAFKKPSIMKDGKMMTIAEVLKSGDYGKVYISLGINELGYPNPDKFIERFAELIDIAKETNPKAEIYVEGILPVSANKSMADPNINNEKITLYNNKLCGMAKNKKVNYLHIADAVADETGALPPEASPDGVHLNKTFCMKWEKYLMENTF